MTQPTTQPMPQPMSRTTMLLSGCVALAAMLTAGLPATSQTRIDYLTPAEVKKIRNIEEPDRKIQLFLTFAADRLKKLEDKIDKAGRDPEKSYEEIAVRFDDYIRAIDDATGHLDMWLDRGGIELYKLRKRMNKDGAEFLERLALLGESRALTETDLTYELEDATEATRDMLALGATIPDGLVPPRSRDTQSAGAPAVRQPGKPTLRRSDEDETGQKKEDKKPPPR